MDRFFNGIFFPVSTALIALEGEVAVSRKDQIAQAYRSYVDDEWTTLIEDAFRLCRETWHYLISEDDEDRHELRGICRHALEFANHFMGVYRDFTLAELRGGERDGTLMASLAMRKTQLQDREIEAALLALTNSADKDVCRTVQGIFRDGPIGVR